jgi:predicted HAD superfamily Cof-like phosphohydrolase
MKQPESLDMVAQFHNTFKHPVLNTPTIPDSKRCELRVSLIAEELDELKEAIEDNDRDDKLFSRRRLPTQ